MEEKQGTVAELIYHNRQNGYSIFIFETEHEQFTAVGTLPECTAGQKYLLRGHFTVHKKYGEQFAFQEYEAQMPKTKDGMILFLSSGVLKGIGPKAARAIVDRFGEETFHIIETAPERLTEVTGIGPGKAGAIAEAFQTHRDFAELSLFFQQYGIPTSQALRLYREYGAATLEIIRNNPYQLIDDFSGFGFRKADAIAQKLGIARDDEERICSGIRYMLWNTVHAGNSCIPERELTETTGQLLNVSREQVEDGMIQMAFAGDLKIEYLEGQKMVYLYAYFTAEQSVTRHLKRLSDADPAPIRTDADATIRQVERQSGLTYSEEQKEAIKASVQQGVSVITGGPGTGKTTIINGILNTLEQGGLRVALAAPTGRAAKRITETSHHPASTIHRLLEYYFAEEENLMRFGKTEEDPLEYDAVIVDEASMIDLMLMDGLSSALRTGTRLILVGDADQLPSVGAGNVLRDIIDSEYVYVTQLKEIFRQARESLIVVNAHRINRGELPAANERDRDFFFLKCHEEETMAETILDLCCKRLPSHYEGCDPVRDIQVLTPVRKGRLGCHELNRRLQQGLNPPSAERAEKRFGMHLFREGDKVMQIRNNYQLKWKNAEDGSEGEGVFNGDIGYIQRIDADAGTMTVVYDGTKYVTYADEEMDEMEVAYAVTVHKSQGSEFPVVIMPVSWFPPMLANRNLLYTAVTRGKKLVVLVGSPQRLCDMVQNNSGRERYSGLRIRLHAMIAS